MKLTVRGEDPSANGHGVAALTVVGVATVVGATVISTNAVLLGAATATVEVLALGLPSRQAPDANATTAVIAIRPTAYRVALRRIRARRPSLRSGARSSLGISMEPTPARSLLRGP